MISKNISVKVHHFVCSIEQLLKNVWFDCLQRKYFKGSLGNGYFWWWKYLRLNSTYNLICAIDA